MNKKVLNIIWNVVSGLSTLYLFFLCVDYIVLFIMEGAVDTWNNTSIEGGSAFFMVVSMIIVLYHVTNKIIIEQFLRAREIIEEKADKKKKTVKKKTR